MAKLIAILKGINVSGHKKILMADLKALIETLGYKNVSTYIQSGNIIFTATQTAEKVRIAIEKAIQQQYNFDVPVIVRSANELQDIIINNPFINKEGVDIDKLHVTFLEHTPDEEQLAAMRQYNYPPDEFSIAGKEVFLHCPVSYGETKLSNAFFEKKLKMNATTRNWKTVGKLAELAIS